MSPEVAEMYEKAVEARQAAEETVGPERAVLCALASIIESLAVLASKIEERR